MQRLRAARAVFRPRGSLAAAVAALTLAGCATSEMSPPGSPCATVVVERVYFGMQYATGTVGEAEWRAFVERVVTPRFPDGLTIYEASGQWRDAQGKIVHEPTRVVEIMHAEGAVPTRAIAEIAAAYKREYGQESVLVVRQRADACF
jgi:hypothetical protein